MYGSEITDVGLCEKMSSSNFIILIPISGYVSYLYEQFFEVIGDAIDQTSDDSFKKIITKLKVVKRPVTLNCKDTAKIMMGKHEMSQRSYKELRNSLKDNNVTLPSYEDLKLYCKNLDVGVINPLHENEESCPCMGYGCTVLESLNYIFKCAEYTDKLTFLSLEKNKKLGDFLREKDAELYKAFDCNKPTIIIRDTGDNFRSVGRYPTEQTSFSILNIVDLVNGPYGQFITTLWRGNECRETLELHCKDHYEELTSLVKTGVTLSLNGENKLFNVVVFLVADLSFVKEILGKCSCTQTYGFFHCNQSIKL